jgi:protein-S-isoprenylcysteine O-methyltransferase Ste14
LLEADDVWRCVPLVLVTASFVIVRWRIRYQRRRYGGSRVVFVHGRTRAQRLRQWIGVVPFAVVCVQSALAAAGELAIAPSTSLRVAGAVLGFGGLALMVQAQLELGASWRVGIEPDARPGLVTRGWYRFSRNPIFAFMLLSWFGLALLLPNALTIAAAAVVVLATRRQVMKEEAWLVDAYGDEYRSYARRVGRFAPLVGRLR